MTATDRFDSIEKHVVGFDFSTAFAAITKI